MKIIKSTSNPLQLKLGVSMAEWDNMREWMTTNNIQWKSAGNHLIEFDTEENATLFALRWI